MNPSPKQEKQDQFIDALQKFKEPEKIQILGERKGQNPMRINEVEGIYHSGSQCTARILNQNPAIEAKIYDPCWYEQKYHAASCILLKDG